MSRKRVIEKALTDYGCHTEHLTSFELADVINLELRLLSIRWHLEYDIEHDAFIMTKGAWYK